MPVFHAVARGFTPGVYNTWEECEVQVIGFEGAMFQKFSTMTEAQKYVQEQGTVNPVVDRRSESEKAAEKKDSSNGSEAKPESKPESCSDRGNGSLSPTLLRMKKDIEKLQKDSSDLKTKFDRYITDEQTIQGASSVTGSLHTSSSTAEKRKHSSDGEEETEDGSEKKMLATDKSKFSTDSEGYMIVYTDGAYQFNGRHGAGVGVFFGHGHPLNVSERVRGKATDKRAAIQAATYAVERAKASGFKEIAVHTHSEYVINCMTSWLKGWKKRNWVKSDGEPVKNKDELIALDKACDGVDVEWVHVKGHDGHEEEAMSLQDKELNYKAENNKADDDD
ncbi:ribonuclease H1-like [Macrobrachium nipponense]|uniref:ribonuclease H1-like n=1 Tax=Macrobrachium nipponense TaxID=159736 RepID=UPI0030C824CA